MVGLLLAGALVATRARADTAPAPVNGVTPPEAAPATKPPAKPKAPGELVSFQVEDAELPDLVKTIGELTGKRFVVATAKPKSLKATVYATQKVTVEEAYRAFLSMLQGNGLTVIPDGGLYKIVESQDAARQTTPIVTDAPAEERYVTRLHRLAHASADEVATLLGKLQTRDGSIVTYAPGNLLIMTDTGTNVRRLLQIVEQVDLGGAQEHLYIEPIYYAASTDIEKKLGELFDLKKKLDGGGAGDLRVSRIVAFERPNALAIVASDASYRRVVDVLRRLDVPVTSDGQVHVVSLQHADAKKIVGPLNDALGAAGGGGNAMAQAPAGGPRPAQLAILESAVKVSADETTNSLLVTSSPRDFAAVKAVIDRLDLPKRQVYIEAVVMEVSAEHDLDLGVAWHGGTTTGSGQGGAVYGGFRPGTSALSPTATDLQAFALGIRGPEITLPFGLPGTGTSTTNIPGIGAFLSAMAKTRGADILSTPQIVASDNTPAELKVQLRIPLNPHAPAAPIFAGGVAVPGGGASQSNLQAIGPRIKVTPHMNDSSEVRIDVEETISDVQTVPEASDTYGSVTWIERSATTTLTVKDGETMVIAGLVRNRLSRTETKVPILGDLPLLGALFRSSSNQNEKSNLVLVLTPHIMRDDADKRRIFQEKMNERQEMIDHAVIFSGQPWTPPVDFSRARGLVHQMRAAEQKVAGERKLEELRAPRDVKEHVPQEPLEMPVTPQSWGGGARAPSAPTPAHGAPAATRVER